MKRITILCVAALVAMTLSESVVAQEYKRVEVTTTYNPEVSTAEKLPVPTDITDSPVIEPEIGYKITPETWQIELESFRINPTKSSFWDFHRPKQFYAQLATGYPLMSCGTLHYATENVRLGYFGCGLDHEGNFARKRSATSVLRPVADSYDIRNRLYVGGGVFAGNQMFEAGLEYKYNIFNAYAMDVAEPGNLQFHDADLSLRYGDDFVNLQRLNFAIEAHGGFWGHTHLAAVNEYNPLSEFSAGGSVRLARKFGKNRVELKGEYDMWQMVSGDYRDSRFGVTAGYARHFGFIDVDAALGYMYDKVAGRAKPSHFFMPRAKLIFDTGLQYISPYVELRTAVSQNGVAALYRENPYLRYNLSHDMLMAMPNTRSYDLALGFSGSAASSRLEYHLYLGANFMRDQVLWYVNAPGLFGVAADNNNRLFVGVELAYKPVGGLLIEGSFYAHKDGCKSPYVVSDAPLKADLRVEYVIKRWKLYVSGDFTGKRAWSGAIDAESGKAPIAFEANATIDLRAGIGFRASKRVEIYADGYNLLGANIYDYAYYYRNGAGFMAGVKIDF
ncbi:MAG: TonB-dependent receptor [Alistipes sp.]|nr:TonB-dependent receptor [Alistipes sp.]